MFNLVWRDSYMLYINVRLKFQLLSLLLYINSISLGDHLGFHFNGQEKRRETSVSFLPSLRFRGEPDKKRL